MTSAFRFLPKPSWRTAILVLLVGVMLVPVIFVSGFFFPFVVPRNLYFRALIEVATAALVIALSFGGKRLDLRGEPILWALAAFLLAAALSALASPAPMHSFFGDFERMGGVWAWLHLLLFFILLRTLRDQDWPWVLNAALAVSLFVSVSAIGQHTELTSMARDGGPVIPSTATIGNSGLLAAYLLMNITIAAYLASTNVHYRLLYLGAGSVNLLALLFAQNRSTAIGLIVGSLIGVLIFSMISNKSRKKWIAPALAVSLLAIVLGAIALIRSFPTSTFAAVMPRVIFRLAFTNPAGSDGSRTMQWQAAIEGFRDRPILGYGPENHNLAWSQHFDPDVYRVATDIFDRTHNQFLEILATGGIVGIIAFLGIWLAIGSTLVRAFRAGRISAPTAGVLWGLQVAYAIYLFFWFVDLNSTMLWIALAALIASRATIGPVVLEATGIDPQPAPARPWLAYASIVLLLAGVYREGYAPLMANRAIARIDAQGRSLSENLADVQLLANSPAHQTFHTPAILGDFMVSLHPRYASMRANARERRAMERAFNQSMASFITEIQRDTLNDRLYDAQARLFAAAADFYGSADYRQRAIDAYHKSIELSPRRIEQRIGLATLYMGERDYERAMVVLTDAVKTDPQLGEPRYLLAKAYIGAGKADSALHMLETSLRLGYVGAPETYLAMGRRLEFAGRGGVAAALYSEYLEAKYTEAVWDQSEKIDRPIPATDLAVAAHLPLLYMRASESELAVKSAAALSAFDPSRAEIVERFVYDIGRRRRANWGRRMSLLPCSALVTTREEDSAAVNACGVFRRKL